MKRFLPIWLFFMSLIFLSGCQETKVNQGFQNNYSKKEIELMMKYHGSLVAKFDGKEWWCLQGKRWIRVNSARAARFAHLRLSTGSNKSL